MGTLLILLIVAGLLIVGWAGLEYLIQHIRD